MVKYSDKKIISVSFVLSVLFHAALFLQFSNATTNNNSQARAPVQDKRISLNLLKPVKQNEKIEPKKVETKKIKPKKKKAKRKTIKKIEEIIQPKHEQAIAPKVEDKVKRQHDEKLASLKQHYFLTLLTHVEGHKYYPRSARARGIEGSIQISFRLLEDGNITGLSAKGESLQLRRAAKQSVINALPLPHCPPEVTCPMQVSYVMQFKLKK